MTRSVFAADQTWRSPCWWTSTFMRQPPDSDHVSRDAAARGATENARLYRRWLSGDGEARDSLVERHSAYLTRFFGRQFVGDVRDLVQRAWLALLESHTRLEDTDRFDGFCFGIARNVARSEIGRRTRRAPTAADVDVADAGPSPADVIEEREWTAQLACALGRLPDDLAEVVWMFYFERRHAPAIGVSLGIPENTIRSRLRRARLQLRSELED